MLEHTHILVIDDSEIDRYILTRQLKKLGVGSVDEKQNAEEALAYFAKLEQQPTLLKPDIVILDINMPRMGGFELLEQSTSLFTHGVLKNTRVLLYSAADADREMQHAQQYACVTGIIPKGATPEQLNAALSSSLQQ